MYDDLLEELMGKRDFYLYTIKHLEFRIMDNDGVNDAKKLLEITFEELRKIENEIQSILSKNFD